MVRCDLGVRMRGRAWCGLGVSTEYSQPEPKTRVGSNYHDSDTAAVVSSSVVSFSRTTSKTLQHFQMKTSTFFREKF